MHTVNIAAFTGVGFLAIGAILSVSDVALSRTAFELMIGPILWIVGCAFMIAWAIGRVVLGVTHGSVSDETPSPQTETKIETAAQKPPAKSQAAAEGSHKKVAGHLSVGLLGIRCSELRLAGKAARAIR